MRKIYKKLTQPEPQDKAITYKENSKPKICVMCGEVANWIAFETKEPLCDKCRNNNDEARERCQ